MRSFLKKFRYGEKCFTLIELLVVVAIIGLLITVMMPMLEGVRELSRQARCLTNHASMVRALHAYHSAWHSFPYNYAYYGSYGGDKERWALGCISSYLMGGTDQVDLRDHRID